MFAASQSKIFRDSRGFAARMAALTLAACVTGCGGGGSSQSLLPVARGAGQSGTSTTTASTIAKVTISIPAGPAASSAQRTPKYVSSATNSATFTPAGGNATVIPLTSTSPNCSTTANGRSCALVVSTASGTAVSFTISTFASADGTGSPLSTVTATQAIVAGQANAINVTLNAVVSALQASLSTPTFTTGQTATSNVGVNVLDAAGQIIAVGPNALVDASGNPVTITVSDSDSTMTSLSSTTLGTAPITLSYNGSTGASTGTITATASSPGHANFVSNAATFTIQAPGALPAITYNATSSCIAHTLYTNDVLPTGVGEFGTNGLNRSYWGGTKTRTVGQYAGTWGPGFETSWGRHQYDTYFGDSSDGTGLDPFTVTNDTSAPGNPQALRIEAMPLPANLKNSLTILDNDQWTLTAASAPFTVPSEGGSLTVAVTNPNAGQNGWTVGMGYQGAAVMFVGKLTSGGAVPSGNGTGGSNPWTISNIHIITGTAGTVITPGTNDEGGLRAYNFPDYYSGTLDTNINQEYGFFVSRMRLPNYLPALSPAFWTLETGGVASNSNGLERNELDIAEMFANTEGNSLNTNEILWNTNSPAGVGVTAFPGGSTPQADYHDYGTLVTPLGTSFYIDGNPVAGDTNLPDWTQGSPDKEIMLMFQVGAPGTWLDSGSSGMSNPWPQYMWSQWIRVFRPTTTSC